IVEREALAQRAPAALQRVALEPEQAGVELDVLAQREPGVEAHLLPNVADVIAAPPGPGDDVDAVDLDRAGGGPEQADQHADRRALAGPVAAEKGEDGAGLDRDAQVVDGGEVAEALREPRGPDDRRAHASPASASSVVSMSTGRGSPERTPPASPSRSRSTRPAPGEPSRRTSMRAAVPVARAPATQGRAPAGVAMGRAASPPALESSGAPRARRSAGGL